ncbi:MAG: DUF1016 domain-containing protein [Blastochloris sp.]|nr:DUF1016 domain-containing protein [Blastochloris sp.]
MAVSRELILLYWQIGRDIVLRQKNEGWGKSIIDRLAADIQKAFPGLEGFSPLNLWRMRSLYLAYNENVVNLSQAATESQKIRTSGIPQSILAQAVADLPPPEVLAIPWFHNVILIQKVKDPAKARSHEELKKGK